ncbi:MAG: hypothetical protein L3J28_02595 [Candidatus Polarisedimenticolaceae bacterium]|nr:hypothetical protein [Candidatus Polarisedimenticolaceae bacterium]
MPNTQPQFTLRQLASDYAENRISRAIYRQRRHQLLDRLANTSEQLLQNTSSPAAEKSGRHAAKQINKLLLLALFLFLFLLMLTGWLFLGSNERTTTEPPASPQQTATLDNRTELEGVIKAFIDNNNWHHDAREKLLKRWHHYDAQTHTAVRQSHWFRILEADLRTLIKEERSLTNGEFNREAKALAAFGHDFEMALPNGSLD